MNYVFVLCCIVFVFHEDETEHSVHYNHLHFHKTKSTPGYIPSLSVSLPLLFDCVLLKGFYFISDILLSSEGI